MNLDRHIALVKGQCDFHHRQAIKYEDQPRRCAMHQTTEVGLAQLVDDLEKLERWQAKYPNWEQEVDALASPRLALSWDEIDGLPPEVLSELSISDSDKAEFQIVSTIKNLGGIASLDRLIVSLWRETGEVHKRLPLNQRLYRMAQKQMIYSVPGKKGVYSIVPIAEEDAAKLI